MTSCMMMYGLQTSNTMTFCNTTSVHHDILHDDVWAYNDILAADTLYNDILQHDFWLIDTSRGADFMHNDIL